MAIESRGCRNCGGPLGWRNKYGYCRRNPECKKLAQRETDCVFYANHPERVKAWSRSWKEAHPEESKERVRQWEKANRAKRQEQQQNRIRDWTTPAMRASGRAKNRTRRSRKAGVPSEDLSRLMLAIADDELGGLCFICGDPLGENYDHDHVIPLSKGGWTGYGNLVPAHGARSDHFACNQRKHTRIDWATPEVESVLDEFIANDGVEWALEKMKVSW